MLVEGDDRAGQGVAGRLVPRDHQQEPEHPELHVVEPVAVDLRVHDPAHDVVQRLGAPGVGHLLAVREQLREGRDGVLRRPAGLRVLEGEQRVAPLVDQVAVGTRHPEQVGEHAERELGRHGGDEVALGVVVEPIDDLAGVDEDGLVEALDGAGREDGLEDPAQARVLGRVHVQHHLAEGAEALRRHRREGDPAEPRREQGLVAEHRGDELVAGDGPEAGAVHELQQRVRTRRGRRRLGVPGDAPGRRRASKASWGRRRGTTRPVREVDGGEVGRQSGPGGRHRGRRRVERFEQVGHAGGAGTRTSSPKVVPGMPGPYRAAVERASLLPFRHCDDGGGDGMTGPLDGIRVVELAVWVAGPGAAGLLADWGADVIKVEPPAGDPARGFGAMLGGDLESNPVFELDNRGKRSIVADLTTDEGATVAADLLAGADVFVTNIRASALKRLGLDAESLLDRHPRLVYAHISGYGLEGEDAYCCRLRHRGLLGPVGHGRGAAHPGRPTPVPAGRHGRPLGRHDGGGDDQRRPPPTCDHGSGPARVDVTPAPGRLHPRVRRQRRPDVGPHDRHRPARDDGQPLREQLRHPRRHRAVDRRAGGGSTLARPRPRWLGRPEWLDDERYRTPRSRAENARELIAELDDIFATRTRDEWAAAFEEEPDLFWAPVNTIEDLIGDAAVPRRRRRRAGPRRARHEPDARLTGRLRGAPPTPRWRVPHLGEHTDEILAELADGARHPPP